MTIPGGRSGPEDQTVSDILEDIIRSASNTYDIKTSSKTVTARLDPVDTRPIISRCNSELDENRIGMSIEDSDMPRISFYASLRGNNVQKQQRREIAQLFIDAAYVEGRYINIKTLTNTKIKIEIEHIDPIGDSIFNYHTYDLNQIYSSNDQEENLDELFIQEYIFQEDHMILEQRVQLVDEKYTFLCPHCGHELNMGRKNIFCSKCDIQTNITKHVNRYDSLNKLHQKMQRIAGENLPKPEDN